MAKLSSYTGSVDLISGIRPKNNGSFPLVDAHDVQVAEDGTRLDDILSGSSGSINESIQEIRDDIGTGSSDSSNTIKKRISALESGKQNNLTFDSTPTANSTNPVTSGGVKAAIDAKTITVDNALSTTSENAVQNKVVKAAIDDVVEDS